MHARYYSILVDEVTSHNQELMPLVIRFVDRNCNIREKFVKLSSLTRLTRKAIASVVVSDLEGLGLDICRIRGQGYDGASNMSSTFSESASSLRTRKGTTCCLHTAVGISLIL